MLALGAIQALLRNSPPLSLAIAGANEYAFCLGQPINRADNNGSFSLIEIVIVGLVTYEIITIFREIVHNGTEARENKDFDYRTHYMVRECKRVNEEIFTTAINGPPGHPSDSWTELVKEEVIIKVEREGSKGFWHRLFDPVFKPVNGFGNPNNFLHPL